MCEHGDTFDMWVTIPADHVYEGTIMRKTEPIDQCIAPLESGCGCSHHEASRRVEGAAKGAGTVTAVEFEVEGSPAAQGSKRHVGNGVMIETAKGHKPWRAAVASAARDVAGMDAPLTGPLRLVVQFRFPMPASRKKAVREAGIGPKVSAPDLDKLIRAVGDGLKEGGLIHDDALFCEIAASKDEVIGWTGAVVKVVTL